MVSPDYADHFRFRVLQDAMVQATAIHWRRRAEQFRAALPRPGDFPGRGITPAQRARRRERLLKVIEECELRALYAERYGLGAAGDLDVERALQEAA